MGASFCTHKFLAHLYLPVTVKKYRSAQSALQPWGICKTKLALACSALIPGKQLNQALNHTQDDDRCALPAFDKYLVTQNVPQVGTQILSCSPSCTCLLLCCSPFPWQFITQLLFPDRFKWERLPLWKPREAQAKTQTRLALGDLFLQPHSKPVNLCF